VIIIKSIDVITEDMKGITLLEDLLPVLIIGAEDLYCTNNVVNLTIAGCHLQDGLIRLL